MVSVNQMQSTHLHTLSRIPVYPSLSKSFASEHAGMQIRVDCGCLRSIHESKASSETWLPLKIFGCCSANSKFAAGNGVVKGGY
jgi:hypothetical protein